MRGVPKGAEPEEVASLFYDSMVEGDLDLWRETLTREHRESMDVKGATPWFWWTTGRRYVESYGVRWQIHLGERRGDEAEGRIKLFFKRLNPDGSGRGMPVPITLVRDVDGEWRVESATV